MNKNLISEGSALIGAELINKYGGFTCGPHKQEGMVGYWTRLINEESEEWNAMGHGLTYDLAITSLFFLIERNELPSKPETFMKSNFYLEN